ncbi:MAG: autotransporter outer membrane beta-barrel domain-containing protein, partial [Asticcacaulis sp.]
VYGATALSPPSVNYGLLVRGTINTQGLYQNVDAVGVQLSGMGHDVNIANGVGVYGSITSTAVGGKATALSFMSGANTPQLDVNGAISSTTTTAYTPNIAADGTITYTSIGEKTAYGVDIAAGASLPKINIAAKGGINATGAGSTNNATAIRDQSNTLTTLNNNYSLSATVTTSDDNGDGVVDTKTGRGIAIDTRSNTVGLTLTQTDTVLSGASTDLTLPAPFILGDVLLGSGDDKIILNGGSLTGNVELGAGNDSIQASAAQIIGNLDFGTGSDSFNLMNKAAYYGKMTNAATGTVALNIDAGNLNLLAGTQLNISSLHVGETSSLGLTLNTASPTTPILISTGPVTFDDGATINLSPDKLIITPTQFTVITAPTIDLGALSSSSLDNHIPYVYHADISTNSGNTELYANLRLKNKDEAQFSDNQAEALAPILTAIRPDANATASLVTQLTKEGFDQVYNQYFPDYSGENILSLSLGSASLNRTLSNLTLVPDNDQGQWWLQEYGYKTKRDYGDTAGFEASAFSFAVGREREVYGNQMLGLYVLYTSATPLDTFAVAKETMVNSDATLGGYWRLRSGPIKAWAHAGAGYTSFKSTRNILTTNVSHLAKADWNGFSYSGGGGISYEYKSGGLGFVPQILADYYALSENKHSETGGGDYFDLNIDKRDSHMLSTTALLNVNYNRYFIRPEIWVGYKQNVSAEIADTVTSFMLTPDAPFTLTGGDIEGGGPIAGFRLSADNQYSYFSLEGEYEQMDAYTNISFSLRTRFQF